MLSRSNLMSAKRAAKAHMEFYEAVLNALDKKYGVRPFCIKVRPSRRLHKVVGVCVDFDDEEEGVRVIASLTFEEIWNSG